MGRRVPVAGIGICSTLPMGGGITPIKVQDEDGILHFFALLERRSGLLKVAFVQDSDGLLQAVLGLFWAIYRSFVGAIGRF